jgi:hypothetical protein
MTKIILEALKKKKKKQAYRSFIGIFVFMHGEIT